MPELPNRGNLGILTPKNDPKLLEFRKFALKNYLQYLLFEKKFRDCLHLRDFLNVGLEERV